MEQHHKGEVDGEWCWNHHQSEEFCEHSRSSPTPSGDNVTLTKAAATAERSLSYSSATC